jgi:hypothetical protein
MAWPQGETQNIVPSSCGNRDNHNSLREPEVCGKRAYLRLRTTHVILLCSPAQEFRQHLSTSSKLVTSQHEARPVSFTYPSSLFVRLRLKQFQPSFPLPDQTNCGDVALTDQQDADEVSERDCHH